MPYQISAADRDKLGAALTAYYEDALEQGYKNLMNNIARANMGVVTGYLDQGKDTWTSLRTKSKDAFGATFKSTLTVQLKVYFGNNNDTAKTLTVVAEKALVALAHHIPVPGLGPVVSVGITYASGKLQDEFHERSIAEADKALQKHTGSAQTKLITNDTDAAQLAVKAMEQYKLICSYVKTLPTSITTFDDAVTLPSAAFKVQEAASSLNVALDNVLRYLTGMQERLGKIAKVVADYKREVRESMPKAVDAMLQQAYNDANAAGKADMSKKEYSAPPSPTFQKPQQPGGATQLAAYLAHAAAQGYYDAGNTGPQIGRPRATGAPPVPPRPAFLRR